MSRADCDAEHCDIDDSIVSIRCTDTGDLRGRVDTCENNTDNNNSASDSPAQSSIDAAESIQSLEDVSSSGRSSVSRRIACTGEPLASLPPAWWENSLKVRVAQAPESHTVAGISINASVRCDYMTTHSLLCVNMTAAILQWFIAQLILFSCVHIHNSQAVDAAAFERYQ